MPGNKWRVGPFGGGKVRQLEPLQLRASGEVGNTLVLNSPGITVIPAPDDQRYTWVGT